MRREYCCVNCGLIWLDKKTSLNQGVVCPECGNDGSNKGYDKSLFACDTFGWFYASKGAIQMLKERDKEIHYYANHPWYGREE